MATTNKFHFIVTVTRKSGDRITKETLRKYVKEAVQSWKGCYSPDSDEFMLNADQFSVRNFIPPSRRVER